MAQMFTEACESRQVKEQSQNSYVFGQFNKQSSTVITLTMFFKKKEKEKKSPFEDPYCFSVL